MEQTRASGELQSLRRPREGPRATERRHGRAHRRGVRRPDPAEAGGGGARRPADQPGDHRRALARGLADAGVDVVDIGLVGTEEVYHATFALGVDGGIMVTASHNPREYNGMKFTREQARPISSDTGLFDIEQMVRRRRAERRRQAGARQRSRAPSSSRDMRPAVHRAPAHLHRRRSAPPAQDRGQPGQRRGRAGDRPAGAAPAFTVRKDKRQARRHVPAGGAQPLAAREPGADGAGGARGGGRPRHRLGRRLRPLLLLRREG